MELNKVYNNFKLINKEYFNDVESTIYTFEHVKTKGKLLYFENEDTNKSFSIGFKTLPEDSTGICHILEHSVLCGSDKFPLKEPFVNLLKGSMATFLNAMTASDFTIYPVASQNDKDFDNLLNVYLDAVFNPLSIKDPKPFLQEGWHLEMNSVDEVPSYKGVVYNEMKGAMSSVNEQIVQIAQTSMLRGTTYEWNSGGDPDVIPELTYEQYKAFYKKHYHPGNALAVLYGKMDILAKLDYIDKEYYSKYDPMTEVIEINMPERIVNMDIESDYEISKEEPLDNNSYMAFSFGLTTQENSIDLLGLAILDEVLMGSNDAPLKKALLDAKISDEVSSMINDYVIYPYYSFILEKANKDKKEEFQKVLFDTLKEIRDKGVDRKALIASINSSEFNNKEKDSGSMSKGIIYSMSAMKNILYGVELEDIFNVTDKFNFFKKEMENNYFESLIDKYFLNSDYKTFVTLNPSNTLGDEKEEKMNKKMNDIFNSLSKEEKEALVKQTEDLLAYQSKKDTIEELKTLPSLSREDITFDVNRCDTEVEVKDGIKFLKHNVSTNGIAYCSLFFDIKHLSLEEIKFLKLLSILYIKLDTTGMNAYDLQSYIQTYLGTLSYSSLYFRDMNNDYGAYLVVGTSCLSENIDKLNVINEVTYNSIFDKEKINTILVQMKNAIREEVIGAGNRVATTEASAYLSKTAYVNAEIASYRYLKFVDELINNSENTDYGTIFDNLIKKVFNRSNLTVSVSGSNEIINNLMNEIQNIKLFENEFSGELEVELPEKSKGALIIPSEVNYQGLALDINEAGYKYNGAYQIASHMINYDYLWNEVRVKGGAYGVRMGIAENGIITMSSYRDPNVVNTYKAFESVVDYLNSLDIDDDQFMTYLIGAVGNYDKPTGVKGLIAKTNADYFALRSKEHIVKELKEMAQATLDDVKSLGNALKDSFKNKSVFTVGNEKKIKECTVLTDINNL